MGSSGPNWGLIVIAAVVIVGVGFIIYQSQDSIIVNPKIKSHES